MDSILQRAPVGRLVYWESETALADELWDAGGAVRLDVLRILAAAAPPGFEDDFVCDVYDMIAEFAARGASRLDIARRVLFELRDEPESEGAPWPDDGVTDESTCAPSAHPSLRLARNCTTSLRIVHLGRYYAPATGGIQTHVRTLARAQAALGANVTVLCVNHAAPGDRNASAGGNDARRQPWAHGITPTVTDDDGAVRVERFGRTWARTRLDICGGLLRRLRDVHGGNTDVIHLHTPNPTMILALAAVQPAVPLVITHHCDPMGERLLRWGLRPFEHVVYGKAAAIHSTSPAYPLLSTLLRKYQARVDLLPMGIDLRPFTHPSAEAIQFRQDLRARHPGPIWLSVGRLVEHKCVDVALQALRWVPGWLLIVGHGPLDGRLRKAAASTGVADRVIWRDYLTPDELVGAYLSATALWFTASARNEAYGLVQVESMACGTPVINTDIVGSGVTWVSTHEETGLTVPVGDPKALAAAALRLHGEPNLRDALAMAARERAVREFDARIMAERSLAVYDRVVHGEPSRQPDWSLTAIKEAFLPTPPFQKVLQSVESPTRRVG